MTSQAALSAKYASQFANIQNLATFFPRSIDEIKNIVTSAKDNATASLNKILDDSQTAPNDFDGICLLTDAAKTEFSVLSSTLSLVKATSPSKDVRDAATAAVTELQAFAIDNFDSNRALFKKFELLKQSGVLDPLPQNIQAAEEKLYWFDEQMKSWQRSGLALPDDKLEEAKSIKKKISDLSISFDRNVAEYKKEMIFTLDQLKGVPENALAALKKPDEEDAENKRIVGLDYPTYFAIMKNCEVAETRKLCQLEFEKRAAPENLDLLRQIIFHRNKFAKLVGFPSFSALDLDSKMAKNTETVRKFIDDLVPKLQKKWAIEKQNLLQGEVHPSVQVTEDGKIPSWDITFLMTQYNKKQLAVDEQKISEYFPMENTIDALLEIYEKFFNLEFIRHKNLSDDKALWHPDVEVLEIHTRPRNEEEPHKSLNGYIIMDLFPREGKYGHACCYGLVPSVKNIETGTFSPPVSVLLCNFPKGSSDKPSLLQHSDAVTFFHEIGHAFHGQLSFCDLSTQSGTRVLRDYVEVPSQCLENWMWDQVVVGRFKHYKTQEPIPTDLFDAKIKSKNAFSGRDYLRQMTFAKYALEIFDKDFAGKSDVISAAEVAKDPKALESVLDTTVLFDGIRKECLPDLVYDDRGRFEAAFQHLLGYGASYYGYAYSLLLSDDVFNYIHERNGLLDPKLGERYKKYIIGPGGSKDPAVLLKGFLEREPNSDAFMKHLGI